MSRTEVIIYRNPIEAWWWDHPEAIINVIYVMIISFIIIMIYGWWNSRKK